MAKTKKATAQQVFKQYLRAEKANALARSERCKLDELAELAGCVCELIEHEGIVFRVSTSGRPWPNAKPAIERVAAVSDLERVIK